jgi:hypothetical protein
VQVNHIEAMKQALELLESANVSTSLIWQREDCCKSLRQAIEQAEQDHTYGYAKGLAEAIFKQHFASDEHYASGRIVWGVNDTVIGILTQIDNMVSDMVRKPQQAEQAQPVATRGEMKFGGCPVCGSQTCVAGACQRPGLALKLAMAEENDKRLAALRAEQAQPDTEPFCYHDGRNIVGKEYADHSDVFPLYTAPPQRKPLTDEEIERIEALCIEPVDGTGWGFINRNQFARAIETAHGIKGEA